MKLEIEKNNLTTIVEINPPKLYGNTFYEWIKYKYIDVLPQLRIEKLHDQIYESYISGFVREELYEMEWSFAYCEYGNAKTIRMRCKYNLNGSINSICWEHGSSYRRNVSTNKIKTEKGLKISWKNIEKKYLNNPLFRTNPGF
jgi:hypothetical protein